MNYSQLLFLLDDHNKRFTLIFYDKRDMQNVLSGGSTKRRNKIKLEGEALTCVTSVFTRYSPVCTMLWNYLKCTWSTLIHNTLTICYLLQNGENHTTGNYVRIMRRFWWHFQGFLSVNFADIHMSRKDVQQKNVCTGRTSIHST